MSFAAIGAGFVLLAMTTGGLGWLYLWPAASFLLVAAGYLGLGPRVLGKRRDGSLDRLRFVLFFPYFAAVWVVLQGLRLGGEHVSDEVSPGIYLGRRPLARDVPEGVSLVVDLTAELRPIPEALRGRSYLCLPTLDGSAPDEVECRALVAAISAWSGPVYIHCAAGHGRSALVAAATLIHRGLSPDAEDAVAMLVRARPRVRMSRAQVRLLERLATRRGATAIPTGEASR